MEELDLHGRPTLQMGELCRILDEIGGEIILNVVPYVGGTSSTVNLLNSAIVCAFLINLRNEGHQVKQSIPIFL